MISKTCQYFCKRGYQAFSSQRERDIWLLGAINILGGCFHSVKGLYDGSYIHPNLFFYILGPSGSGKGALEWAQRLILDIHNSIKKTSEAEFQQYEQALKIYESKVRRAPAGNHGNPPKEAFPKYLLIPGNSSGAAIITQLKRNGGMGVICETEVESLVKALQNDWGQFDNLFNKAYHHEILSSNKLHNGVVEVLNPKLSIALSGTPKQVYGLIKSVDSGLFNRFGFYMFNEISKFRDVSPEGSKDREPVFGSLAKELEEYYIVLNAAESEFIMDSALWVKLVDWANKKQEHLIDNYADEAVNYVKRAALQAYRITMILSTIRMLEQKQLHPQIKASSLDLEVALQISDVLFENMLALYTKITKNKPLPIHLQIYNALGDSFTRSEFVAKTIEFNRSERSADGYIAKLKSEGFLKEGYTKDIYEKIEQENKGL